MCLDSISKTDIMLYINCHWTNKRPSLPHFPETDSMLLRNRQTHLSLVPPLDGCLHSRNTRVLFCSGGVSGPLPSSAVTFPWSTACRIPSFPFFPPCLPTLWFSDYFQGPRLSCLLCRLTAPSVSTVQDPHFFLAGLDSTQNQCRPAMERKRHLPAPWAFPLRGCDEYLASIQLERPGRSLCDSHIRSACGCRQPQEHASQKLRSRQSLESYLQRQDGSRVSEREHKETTCGSGAEGSWTTEDWRKAMCPDQPWRCLGPQGEGALDCALAASSFTEQVSLHSTSHHSFIHHIHLCQTLL